MKNEKTLRWIYPTIDKKTSNWITEDQWDRKKKIFSEIISGGYLYHSKYTLTLTELIAKNFYRLIW